MRPEVTGEGLKPLTSIQVPTESSQAAGGSARRDPRPDHEPATAEVVGQRHRTWLQPGRRRGGPVTGAIRLVDAAKQAHAEIGQVVLDLQRLQRRLATLRSQFGVCRHAVRQRHCD